MSFIADKQTLEDLNLLSKYRSNSTYAIFNAVRTNGGKKLLDQMFDFPMTVAEDINTRSGIFQYFEKVGLNFPLNSGQFEVMEDYLGSAEGKDYLDLFRIRLMAFAGLDKEYKLMQDGFYATVELLSAFHDFISNLSAKDQPLALTKEIQPALAVFKDKRLDWLPEMRGVKDIAIVKIAAYDAALRYHLRDEMKLICRLIYLLDVYTAVSAVGKARGFTYAEAVQPARHILSVDGFYHPEIKNAVSNSLLLDENSNVLFLTGANMAGKSTTMKAFGITVYLAHMGFPVPARKMVFSVKDGLYTSINVPDNLNMGLSHFYAEVLRVKTVAEEVSRAKSLVVIFDELFKGTNVKDAYDATLSVTQAFSAHRNCAFIISTHIIEVGEALGKACDNLQFVYLPTVMDGVKPTYTYKLQQGITNDRHGMMLINNEKILEMIKDQGQNV
jgi:DNA mismatch repair protein MutS